jgi:excisionase family DNA binding protein
VDVTRLEALLEAVRAVQESVSGLEREIMSALAEGNSRSAPSTKQPGADELLTLGELEELLKVGRTTIYRLLSTREIPSYRIGRSVRVGRTDVDRWLEGRREKR